MRRRNTLSSSLSSSSVFDFASDRRMIDSTESSRETNAGERRHHRKDNIDDIGENIVDDDVVDVVVDDGNAVGVAQFETWKVILNAKRPEKCCEPISKRAGEKINTERVMIRNTEFELVKRGTVFKTSAAQRPGPTGDGKQRQRRRRHERRCRASPPNRDAIAATMMTAAEPPSVEAQDRKEAKPSAFDTRLQRVLFEAFDRHRQSRDGLPAPLPIELKIDSDKDAFNFEMIRSSLIELLMHEVEAMATTVTTTTTITTAPPAAKPVVDENCEMACPEQVRIHFAETVP
ncbi:hypothetical protein CYMTET_48975 [Cymbomonas tetramitiformis]|uniref:Uncharacterized protein n=1 Tax=Cymbomonas tetramitiformis TaxID=36881 RepID=A0AAE0EUZ9_9CHLO|nr:hypothetical protein CYMTET_48975 [Cymbomonas tetramitiformis]